MGNRRGAVFGAGLGVLGLALSGCLTVPHSGRVNGGVPAKKSGAFTGQGEVRINPAPPTPAAAAGAIVSGFYDAMVDTTDHYYIAKQYFATGTTAWTQDPKSVDIADDTPRVTQVGVATPLAATFDVSYTKVAQILADHEFVATKPTAVTDRIQLVRDPKSKPSGEWRIVNPPVDLRLSVPDFNNVYREATLYFPRVGVDAGEVPDRLFFASTKSDLADNIAAAYAAGPSDLLATDPGIAPLLPKNSTGSVSGDVASGSVTANFTVPAFLGQSQQAQLFSALRSTFNAAFPDLASLTVTINRQTIPVPLLPGGADPHPRSVINAWFIDGAHDLRPWDNSVIAGGATPAAKFGVTSLTGVSLSPRAQFAAGVLPTPAGKFDLRVVSRSGLLRDVPIAADRLTAPAWSADNTGVWVAGDRDGRPHAWFIAVASSGEGVGASYEVASETQDVRLDPSITPKDRLLDLRPSPDGLRISAIIKSNNVSELYVGRIDRSNGLAALNFRLDAPVLLRPEADKAAAFTVSRAVWTSGEYLTAVASSGSGSYDVWTASMDGSDVQQNGTSGLSLDETTQIAAAVDAQTLAVDAKRRVWYLEKKFWKRLPSRVDRAKVLAVMYAG